jgi:hypothetical protein
LKESLEEIGVKDQTILILNIEKVNERIDLIVSFQKKIAEVKGITKEFKNISLHQFGSSICLSYRQ